MFFPVSRYVPAHFQVSSNIFPCRFRTYWSEAIASGLVRFVTHSREQYVLPLSLI